MEFTQALQAYMEVGFLGLCGVLVCIMFYLFVKRSHQKEDEKDNNAKTKDDVIQQGFTSMMDFMKEQFREQNKQQMDNNKLLLNAIISGVTNHVPSQEENTKLTNVSTEINNHLQQILLNTNASRTNLVQYHNGGKGINKQSFLKMSITNEQVQLGVKPFIGEFKDQFRNLLAYFVQQLDEQGYCYIEDREFLKDKDISTYEFLKDRGIEAKYGMAIRDNNGMVIGFVSVEYLDKNNADVKIIDKVFKEQQKVFETLLNL